MLGEAGPRASGLAVTNAGIAADGRGTVWGPDFPLHLSLQRGRLIFRHIYRHIGASGEFPLQFSLHGLWMAAGRGLQGKCLTEPPS